MVQGSSVRRRWGEWRRGRRKEGPAHLDGFLELYFSRGLPLETSRSVDSSVLSKLLFEEGRKYSNSLFGDGGVRAQRPEDFDGVDDESKFLAVVVLGRCMREFEDLRS